MTCEPVLTEAAHLLARAGLGPATIASLARRGLFEIPFRIDEHSRSIEKLLRKYADVPMCLADACLVRMSELLDDAVVLTLDSDFTVYRRTIGGISHWYIRDKRFGGVYTEGY